MLIPPVYNDANFRAQFPAFANPAKFPEAILSGAWTIGGTYLSQQPACWGLGWNSNSAQLQRAADLMGAVIVSQYYGPTVNGQALASEQGEASGPVSAATEGSVSVTIQLPAFGSSAFMSFLLKAPPYGAELAGLLQQSASVGPYIPSGRPAWIPP